ncbi:dienelactone hydrolase family protein [Bacillus sp. Marseille-P3661]|uniref:dienelactone hydrolase family protein n=1 Tax=Bacillus sp. Marseille-P3661 TaxID=1936234 RepID=UPI000C829D74|nr:dienelactone hydrolase family protein [Bacillus sp. Marseille-P3661]
MGLETKWIRYGNEQEYVGYMAKIDRVEKDLPVVVVIQEIWGVNGHIQDVTERFAKAGYLAFAPNLYERHGEPIEDLSDERVEEVRAFQDSLPRSIWSNIEEREKAIQKLPEEKRKRISRTFAKMFGGMDTAEYIKQLLATTTFLREECEVSKGQGIASIGYCMGGALSALLACHDSQLKGAVIFYGNAPSQEELAKINCPVYGFYGELDKRITDQVPVLSDHMKQQGKDFSYKIYKDTHHAFFNDTRSSYNIIAARDAYQTALQFFNDVLTTE